MEDALLGATVEVVLEKAISLATERIGLVFGFKEELESLRESAAMIQAVLADAEEKQGQIQAIKLWLKGLEGVAFEADYVLDELNYENLRRKVELQSQQLKGKVCFFFSFSCTDITFHWRMASRIRGINIKLERINQKAKGFGLRIMHQNEASLPATTGATLNRQTDSIAAQNVVGRAVDESKIVEMLLSSSEEILSVVAITGMSGLGKTTLAKRVYNNPRIDGHFNKKVWVCLSKKIGIVELFKFILESSTREKFELDLRDAIVQKLRQDLMGKRYLLVLDDMWNNEQGLWDDFFTTMEGLHAANGSWCLVTTRLEQVAYSVSGHFMTNADPYFLRKLSDDDCWSIVKEKAIAGVEVPEELKAMRNEIIKRCDGLPLAASVIGGLLRVKRKEEWLAIVEKNLLSGDQTGVQQILKASFDHLSPASVKKCFAYCSIFPKDTLLERDLLIELWMAEGYLVPTFENEIVMEKIGDKYFEILLQSSLLEEVRGESATYYRMHDLVHDFAESILEPDSSSQVCYHAEGVTEDTTKDKSTSVRTLFLESRISDDVLMKFKNLHVLKLFGSDFLVLPTSIGQLIHLRFLDLSNSRINSLPDSVCKLYNLQTLRVKEYQIRTGLPKHLCNLISLRHLHCYVGNADFQMPAKIGLLTGLQTLEFFNIGQTKGHQIEELGCLKDLKGSLEIRHLELVKGREGAKLARLFEKANLVELKLEWGSVIREGDNCDSEVLEGIQPHPNLKKLVIQNFMGNHFPQWLINLSSLVELRLMDCRMCVELPALGQLPSLQDLELDGLENITCMGLSFYGIDVGRMSRSTGSCDGQIGMPRKFFPTLKALSLKNMGNLAEWEDVEVGLSTAGETLDAFPMLESLFIYKCSNLVNAPSQFPSLKKLEIKDNCNVSLLRKILSSLTAVSSIELYGGMAELYDDQHLESLYLVRHRNLEDVRQGTSFERLSLNGCGSLCSEMVETLCHFPSLQNIALHHCPNLTRISGCGTSVEHLELWNCDSLSELPKDLGNFRSLYNLEIKECPSIIFPEGDYNLSSLQYLTINCCNGLISLPSGLLWSCTSLRQLKVYDCPDLVSFPLDLQQTPSLSWIAIYKCPKLVTMPKGFGFLTSLKELWIGPFLDESFLNNEFDWSGLISLSTLHELELYGLPHENSLPDQLQFLTNLKHLYLYEFGGLEALPDWIGNLTSLECLYIKHCKKLQYLPSMAAMRRLTNLRSLYINGSPLLMERCNPESGSESERSKISLIRNHWIGHSLSL